MAIALVEQQLALAFEAARLGSWIWDMESGTTTWDERLEEMHGLAPGGFGGTFEDWVAAIHPGDREDCLMRVQEALASPGPYTLIHRTMWKDGSVHTIECRGTVFVDSANNPLGTTGVAIDVTRHEHIVQTLQRSLLPTVLPQVPNTTVATRYRTAERHTEIGGDWYAAVALANGCLGVAIGDVAGHGLDAVAHMASARFSLRALALNEIRPAIVLDQLNQVVETFEGTSMITAIYGVIDPNNKTWTYASAGHVPAVLRHADGTVRLIDEPPDPPLGVGGSAFRAQTVALAKGDILILYTDGLIERRTESLTDGLERLGQVCSKGPREVEPLCDYLLETLHEDQPNEDDVAIIAIAIV